MQSRSCSCGCGSPVTSVDRFGQLRRYISGHNSRGTTRKPRSTFVCIQCSKTNSVIARQSAVRKFCGSACRDAHRRKQLGPSNPSWNHIATTCPQCGKSFETIKSRLSRRGYVYCSSDCAIEGRRAKIAGSRRKSRPMGKNHAKRRDLFQCRLCGFDLAVQAHHIIPRREGGSNSISNIITLCPNHHASVHAGLISRSELSRALEQPIDGEPRRKARHNVNYRTA